MKLQKKKNNSIHYLIIFVLICGILAAVSVFAGGVLTPVKSAVTIVLSPMQKGMKTASQKVSSKPKTRSWKNVWMLWKWKRDF